MQSYSNSGYTVRFFFFIADSSVISKIEPVLSLNELSWLGFDKLLAHCDVGGGFTFTCPSIYEVSAPGPRWDALEAVANRIPRDRGDRIIQLIAISLNASRGLCECEKDEWRPIRKWSQNCLMSL
ncbi:hypothetical protein QVD17_37454 [Tagetes erecta]|uniref:Uncharacterized protein n=1 Tax=Tagetes erecta TaxID=13708 RepID=A0AAD8NJ71_TARER|nr:hypothetical protein QVD17_37454 [Tagetes erecta]